MSIIRWELSDVIVFAAMLRTTKARQSFKRENSLHQHCVPGNLLHKQIPIRRDNERGKGNGQMYHGIQDIVLLVLCYEYAILLWKFWSAQWRENTLKVPITRLLIMRFLDNL